MTSYDRRDSAYRTLYARLLLAMSWDQALETLGFPGGSAPSEGDVEKRRRQMAIKNHPDRGGNPALMVEVNVAADILTGKGKPGRRTPSADPEAERRREQERKRNLALQVIDRAESEVSKEIERAVNAAEIGKGKLHLRDFFSDDYADALDKMQDMIEKADKPHPDMRKADALCGSLSNKALRLGKRYLTLLKLQGEASAGLIGLGGADPITFDSMAKLYSETSKFVAAFMDMWQESRKLIGLIRTSEFVPIEWEDVYSHSHNVLDSFAGKVYGFGSFDDRPLKEYQKAVTKAVKDIGDAVLEVAPEEWKKAPSADQWKFPQDFTWAKEAVKEPGAKNAYSYGR